MSTIQRGRIGGQYMLELMPDNRYRVSGMLYNEHKVTIFTGAYEEATKVLDYCAMRDGQAQAAMQMLYIEGDPTDLMQLAEDAKNSTEARTRRRIAITVEVETDVLEGENSLNIATQQVGAALRMVGMRTNYVEAYYHTPPLEGEDPTQGLHRIAAQRDELLGHVTTPSGFYEFKDGNVLPCRVPQEGPSRPRDPAGPPPTVAVPDGAVTEGDPA